MLLACAIAPYAQATAESHQAMGIPSFSTIDQMDVSDAGSGEQAVSSRGTPLTDTVIDPWVARMMVLDELNRWQSARDEEDVAQITALTQVYALNLSEARDHWLGAHLQLAGKTSENEARRHGQLGLRTDGLLIEDHSMRLDFNESDSFGVGQESESLSIHYDFPVGEHRFDLSARRFEYENTVVGADNKFQASGDGRVFNLSTRRSLFSLGDLSVESRVQVSSVDSRRYEEGNRIEQTSSQLSMVLIEGTTERELWFDVSASTKLSLANGLEVTDVDYRAAEGREHNSHFQKVMVTGCLSRQVFQWQWELSGRYQFADSNLPDSQAVLVAGPGLISGFNGQSRSAKEGGWLRVDANSPSLPLPLGGDTRSDLRLSVLRGWAPLDASVSDRYGSASVAEIALNVEHRDLQADITVGRMIANKGLTPVLPNSPDVSLSFSLGL